MNSLSSVWKIVIFLVLAGSQVAHAEPWLATRYAQNCAGCHAPGRINLEPADRRCSLSCQGCHVNPNGGGLRSHYGKWNENRVLRSWVSESEWNEKPFAANKHQRYSKKPYKKLKKKQKKSKKFRKLIEQKGLKLVKSRKVEVKDSDHDRFANPYDVTAEDRVEFLYQVPQEDPYRQMYLSKFDGGVDLRWQYASGEIVQTDASGSKSEPIKVDNTFFMSGDFALRYRPIYKQYHFVYESRMLGSPSEDAKYQQTISQAQTRSLYVMRDDIPYNVFAMYGYYRPLFGNYSPDHTLLSQKMLANALDEGTGYNIGPYETFSVGTAPNVPYANLHVLLGDMDPDSKLEGFVLNTGLRFVSYSASVNYTYWNSKKNETTSELHSFHVAGKLGPVIANYEASSYSKESETDLREGGSHFLDFNVQAYREIYGVFQYSMANVNEDLTPGEASQMKAGVKGFLYPGMEVQLLYETKSLKAEVGPGSEYSAITSQLHLYM